ncbi:MAG: ORF6N domain-containing protein [Candidatus Riflebacteria bacterium]|nr:ORF6N domain-containing protein [Candidatus Riflebacteria bacterium]
MKKKQNLTRVLPVDRRIITVRGQPVMVDADLASLYGVTTKALNQAVKRNSSRFPTRFMFQLDPDEKLEVVTNCDHLSGLRFSHVLPFVFTEKGVLMLANVLKSPRAIDVSIAVIEAFVRLRASLLAAPDLVEKIARIEEKLAGFQDQLDAFQGIVLPLLTVHQANSRKIGFDPGKA